MPRVLLTTCCPNWPFARQTPGRLGIWEDFEFVIDKPHTECDAWVVFDGLPQATDATCVPDNLFFIPAEPPDLRSYRGDFLRQFRWVVTCHDVRHRGLIAHQQAHPWHVGVDYDCDFATNMDYDDLITTSPTNKPHLLSTVISNKAITPAHRQRLDFVQRLKQRLGDDFHILGQGHQPIGDKWDAVAPYRFHLALENASLPHYLTEKICDAFLGSAFPFYFGAPNAGDYFPNDSFEPIDIFQPDAAIDQICAGIDAQLDVIRRSNVEAARRIVLDKLNIFPTLVQILRERMVPGQKRSLRLYPKNQHIKLAFSGIGRLLRAA